MEKMTTMKLKWYFQNAHGLLETFPELKFIYYYNKRPPRHFSNIQIGIRILEKIFLNIYINIINILNVIIECWPMKFKKNIDAEKWLISN